MRNLIITREKSFVASLLAMKIYIEDPVSGDTTINGTLCRKLGSIKNGEQKYFQIGDAAARIFVIQDKLSKGFCNEFFDVPAGCFDVALKGKNHYNPLAGNPFRFEGTANEEVVKNRKKTGIRSLIVMIIALLVGFGLGFLNNMEKPETFSNEGMTITLTNDFSFVRHEDFTACYTDGKYSVLAIREDFSLFGEGITFEEYMELVLYDADPEIKPFDYEGITCLQYYSDAGGEEYGYFVAVFEAEDAFWCVNFAAEADDFENALPLFREWAKTISFE